jgi:tRNA(Ile)-lysidine synthetase-like protein
MNADPAHRRVWLRREVIPALEAGAARDLRVVLARQAEVARADADLLDTLAGALLVEAAGGVGPCDRLDGAVLRRAPEALLRRAVRLWLGPPAPSAAHVDEIVGVVRGQRKAAELPGGTVVTRSGGMVNRRLDICRGESTTVVQPAVDVDFPGTAVGFGVELVSWVERAPPVRWPDGRWTAVVDADLAGERGLLRPAEAKERFVPLGLTGHKAVADALAEIGVPAAERARHPILAGAPGEGQGPNGSPLWVLGYRIDDRVRVSGDTRRFLWLTVEAGGPWG